MKAVLRYMLHIFLLIILIIKLPFLFILVSLIKRRPEKPRLVWGPVPLISNKYWSASMKKSGYFSETLMSGYYETINNKDDFDRYTENTFNLKFVKSILDFLHILDICKNYRSFIYAILHFDIFHHHFTGGFIGNTPFWRIEAVILHLFGKKIIITGFGGDFYRYSFVNDLSWRHGLLNSYPEMANKEKKINKRVQYWVRHADIIINGLQIDGMSRWNLVPYNMVVVDISEWPPKKEYSKTDGKNGIVYVTHTPNHRGAKGTEFIIQAVDTLKKEGLQVELLLIEKAKNTEIRTLLSEKTDILAEQLLIGYALSAIEGMACGLPVLSNLSNEEYTRMFRRFSYLNECPVLSTTPENVTDNLRILVTQPELRVRLGKAGVQYVNKYHSGYTAQYMFGLIYDKIWAGKNINLMNIFHPVLSDYNKSLPYVEHPLFENRIV